MMIFRDVGSFTRRAGAAERTADFDTVDLGHYIDRCPIIDEGYLIENELEQQMTYRVVQWTTGIVGRSAVKGVIARPDTELVGAFAWSDDKVGVDVGLQCGLDPIGIASTNDVDALIALKPDVALYMPLHWDVDVMVLLLEAGINVISTANFITGHSYGDADRARLDDAARRGGASLYGTGINPGFANVLGLVSTGVCRRVEQVSVLESVDCTAYASPTTWYETGFAVPPDTPGLDQKAKERQGVFVDAVEMMAAALHIELDEITYTPQWGVATERLDLGYMTIEKGHTCGLKGSWVGKIGDASVIELALVWRLGSAMEPDWPTEEGYVIDIKGEPDVHCEFKIRHQPDATDFGGPTAHPAVNAIPHVVAAAPGIVTAAQLPLIVADGRSVSS